MFKSKKFKIAVCILLGWYVFTSPGAAADTANRFIGMLEQGGNSAIQFLNGISL